MEDKIICPGKNLERLLLLLEDIDFKSLDEEPSIEQAKMFANMSRIIKHEEEIEEMSKEEVNKAYRRFLRKKIEERNGAEELASYGQTYKQISASLGEHVANCSDCSRKYADFVMKEATMRLEFSEMIVSANAPSELIEYAKEEVSNGLYAIVKQEDERYLRLLK